MNRQAKRNVRHESARAVLAARHGKPIKQPKKSAKGGKR